MASSLLHEHRHHHDRGTFRALWHGHPHRHSQPRRHPSARLTPGSAVRPSRGPHAHGHRSA